MVSKVVVDFLYNAFKYDLFEKNIKNPCKRGKALAEELMSKEFDKLSDEDFEKALNLLVKADTMLFCGKDTIPLSKHIELCASRNRDVGVKLIAYALHFMEIPNVVHLDDLSVKAFEAGLIYRYYNSSSVSDFVNRISDSMDFSEEDGITLDEVHDSFDKMSMDDCMVVAAFLYEAQRSRFFDFTQHAPVNGFINSVKDGQFMELDDGCYHLMIRYINTITQIIFNGYEHLKTKDVFKNAVVRLDEASAKRVIEAVIEVTEERINKFTIDDGLGEVFGLPLTGGDDDYIEALRKIVSDDEE